MVVVVRGLDFVKMTLYENVRIKPHVGLYFCHVQTKRIFSIQYVSENLNLILCTAHYHNQNVVKFSYDSLTVYHPLHSFCVQHLEETEIWSYHSRKMDAWKKKKDNDTSNHWIPIDAMYHLSWELFALFWCILI